MVIDIKIIFKNISKLNSTIYENIMNIYQLGFILGMQGWIGKLMNITHYINRLQRGKNI